MSRAIAVFLALAMVLAGCSQPGSNAPKQGDGGGDDTKDVSVPADVPTYDVTKDEKAKLEGIETRNVAASTDAKF